MDNKQEITNFDELSKAFKELRDETKEQIKSDLKEFAKLSVQIPKIAKEMAIRGMEDKIAEIDESFEDLGQEQLIANEYLDFLSKDNLKKNQSKSNVVSNIRQNSLNIRARIAVARNKVTTLVGKGLVLVGKKGLAKELQEKSIQKGEESMDKDSKTAKIVEKSIEKGTQVVDTVKNVKDNTIKGIKNTKENVKDGIKNAKENVKDGINKAKTNVRDGINKAKTNVKEGIQQTKTAVKETGKKAKEKIVDTAETAWIAGDDIKRTVKDKVVDTAETAWIVGDDIKQGIKNTTKKTALQIGKSTYKGAAVIAGIGMVGVEAAAKGVKAVAGKIKENVNDKVNDAKDYIETKSDTIKDYKDIAKNKFALRKNQMALGIKSKISEFAQSVLDKVTPSLEKNKEKIQEKEIAIAASRDNISQRSEQLNEGEER